MSYRTVADMVDSASLIRREYAAIAKEGIDPPEGWQYEHRWMLAASPGWDAAWDSAVAGGVEDPGDDQGVITDGMILSAVQKIVEDEKPPIVVTPGSTQTVASTHPKVVAEPLTAWGETEFATFTDGEFTWDGSAWQPYVVPAPFLSALSPATASITDPDFEGHLLGLGFDEDAVIVWNGADEPTRFISAGDIWTMVVPSVVTAPTVLDVYVRNGDGQVSNILPFTWEA